MSGIAHVENGKPFTPTRMLLPKTDGEVGLLERLEYRPQAPASPSSSQNPVVGRVVERISRSLLLLRGEAPFADARSGGAVSLRILGKGAASRGSIAESPGKPPENSGMPPTRPRGGCAQ
jgi:hypothetical protein